MEVECGLNFYGDAGCFGCEKRISIELLREVTFGLQGRNSKDKGVVANNL